MIENDFPLGRGHSQNHEHLKLIVDSIGIGIWDWQVQTDQLTFNERWAEMIGYSSEELVPVSFTTWAKQVHPVDLKIATKNLEQYFIGETDTYEVEIRLLHKLGHYIWVVASGKVVEWSNSREPKRMIGIHVDITHRKTNEESLIVTSQLLNESQQVAGVGGWELDLKSGQLFWTDETYRIHETSPDEFNPTVDAGVDYFLPESKELIIKALDDAVNHGIGYDLELETYTTKGTKIDVRTTCIVTKEENVPVRLMGIFQDISSQKAIQRKLQKSNIDLETANAALKLSAHYDPLTELPNRYLLADRMQQAISKSARNNNLLAIAFIDIDGFKEINDSLGHDIGDELLKKIAVQLSGSLRAGDTLSRIGGDEFVAIIDNLSDLNENHLVLNKMLESVAKTVFVNKHALNVSASIGVTLYPLDNGDPDHLLRHADQAMYIAKQRGKNCYHIFDIEKDVARKNHNEKITRISEALSNNEFLLYYQPKIDLRSKQIVGVEALIRWNHPTKGILGPFMFLPEVERTSLEIEVGKWVIQAALKQLHEWQSSTDNLPISVNISPLHLQHPEFINELKDYLNDYPDFEHGSLDFEIVESSALNDFQLVSQVITECKQLGVSFSIDDFGVGYSSLLYLKRLPVKFLKIDQSFVREMLHDIDNRAIIQGIIELAKVFNLTIIAEGVETPEHGIELLALGSYYAQGYGIARPMPATDFLPWMAAWKQRPRLIDGRD